MDDKIEVSNDCENNPVAEEVVITTEIEPTTEVVSNNSDKNSGDFDHDGKFPEEKSSPSRKKFESSRKGRKRKRKAESSYSSSSSSTSSSSTSSSDSEGNRVKHKKKRRKSKKRRSKQKIHEDKDNEPASKRFKVVREEEKYKWKLPPDMAKYANLHLNEFIPESTLKEAVLLESPVPDNINEVKVLDDYIKESLKDRNQKSTLFLDNIYERLQKKNSEVMGPLSKVWWAIDQAKSSKDDNVLMPVSDLLLYLEQSVLLIGQQSNLITYHRRMNVMNNLMNPAEVKSMLKEKASLLQQDDKNLFGKQFREHLTETIKAKKQSKEIFCELSTEKKRNSMPFRNGPSVNGGRNVYFPKFRNNRGTNKTTTNRQTENYQNTRHTFRGKRGGFSWKPGKLPFITRANLFQQHESKADSLKQSSNDPPSYKKVVSKLQSTRCSSSWSTGLFREKLGKINQGSNDSGPCKGLQNSFPGKSLSGEASSSNKNEFKGGKISGFRSGPNVEKGGHCKSSSRARPIFEQYFSSKEKGWGEQACDKSKTVESFHPLSTLQNGGYTFSETYVARGRFHVQARFERCILFCTIRQAIQKICQISLVREFVRIPLPMFWVRTSTQDLFKTNENTNLHSAQDKYPCNNLLGRYAFNGNYNRGSTNESRHSNLPIATVRFCNK